VALFNPTTEIILRGKVIADFGDPPMLNDLLLKVHFRIRDFLAREDGQDLVEYALVVALISFGAVTAMKALSTEIKTAFTTISSELGSSL
jgi:pilus assembly protein Flp/PilA